MLVLDNKSVMVDSERNGAFLPAVQGEKHARVNHNLFSDTREASLLFSYAKEVSESGALDQDDMPEDVPGKL